MATAKKGKKTSKSKKNSKSKKKSSNSNFFTSFMLVLLVLAMIVAAVFLTLNNFNIKGKESSKDIKEVVVKKEEKKNTDKPAYKQPETRKEEIKKEVSNKDKSEQKKETKKESQRVTNLSGCWISNEQGAFITLDQYGYRIDFSNVDASKPLTGNYYIENNLIVFTSDGNECNGTEGSYRITFYKKNFSLICKDDDCTSRRNILEADWEWMEI